MVQLPSEFPWGEYVIRLSQGNHCIRWDVLDELDRESLAHGHEGDSALAMSEAFDWIASNVDYVEDAA